MWIKVSSARRGVLRLRILRNSSRAGGFSAVEPAPRGAEDTAHPVAASCGVRPALNLDVAMIRAIARVRPVPRPSHCSRRRTLSVAVSPRLELSSSRRRSPSILTWKHRLVHQHRADFAKGGGIPFVRYEHMIHRPIDRREPP